MLLGNVNTCICKQFGKLWFYSELQVNVGAFNVVFERKRD